MKIDTLAIPALIILLFMSLSLYGIISFRNYLDPEAEVMLVNYTSPLNFLQKIFNQNGTDWGAYQARELSYVIDYFDYNILAFCIKRGFVFFFSLSNYIGIGLIIFLFFMFSNKHLGLDIATSSLLLLLFLTSPGIAFSGSIFRSAKIGVAASLMGLFFLLYKKYKGEAGNNIFNYLLIFLASLSATFFDRQGVYLVCASIVMVCFLPSRPGFSRWRIAGILLSSVAINYAWNYLFCPLLMSKIVGYRPSFDFQKIDFRQSLLNMPDSLWAGLYLYLCTIMYMVGNNEILLYLLLLFYFIIHPLLISKGPVDCLSSYRGREKLAPQRLAIICSLLIMVMNGLMFENSSYLILDDIQRVYYWMPTTVVILFGLSLMIKSLSKTYNPRMLRLVLILLLTGNILSIPEHNHILCSGHLKKRILLFKEEVVPMLKKARDAHYEIPAKFQNRALYIFIQREMRHQQKIKLDDPRLFF